MIGFVLAAAALDTVNYVTVSVSIQWILSIVTSALLFRLEQDRQDIKDVEQRLHSANDKLIDERMRGLTHEFMGHAQQVTGALDLIKVKVKEQDSILDRLGESNHTLDMKLLREIKDLQLKTVETTATKADLQKHQDSMASQVREIREEIRGRRN